MLSSKFNQLKQLILQKVPILIESSLQIQKLVSDLAKHRKETTDKFYQLLGGLSRDREEQVRKWEEHNRLWKEVHEGIQERNIGALGAFAGECKPKPLFVMRWRL